VISGNLYLATGETLDRNGAKKLPVGSFGYWLAGMNTPPGLKERPSSNSMGLAHGKSTTSIRQTTRGTQRNNG
jgi:hypothetical protein